MKILGILTLVVLFNINLHAQQNGTSFKDAPLREVILFLESKHEIIFSFRDQNLTEEYINFVDKGQSIHQSLELIFSQTNLDFQLIDDRHIILTLKKGLNDITYDICGIIKDKTSGLALSFASVQIKDSSKGVSAGNGGSFELKGLNEADRLIFSYVGYDQKEYYAKLFKEQPCKTIFLEFKENAFEPIIVTEYLTSGIEQSDLGNSLVIKPNELSVLPGAVEPDVMASIQLLPGIFSANETISGINIRGGTPDQNLILYDGIPVYHTGHFFGMISAFNPYIVEGVDVYRSGIGTEFGGRVSGVIDIHSNSKVPDKIEIGAGLNFTHGHLNLAIPIVHNSAISLSARRSFTDFWSTPTFVRYAEKIFQGTKIADSDFNEEGLPINDKFYFNDANLKWIWNPGKNKFGFNLFGGLNNLDYASAIPQWNAFSLDDLKLENGGFSMFWDRDWSDRFSTKLKVTNSRYDYNYNLSYRTILEPDSTVFGFSSINLVKDEGFSWTNHWKPFQNQQIKFGYQYTFNDINVGLRSQGPGQNEIEEQKFENKLHTLFGEYNLTIPNILDLDLGLRFQEQTVIGNEYFEPRVALSSRVNEYLKLKLSSSKQFQFISQLVILGINDIGISNQIWISSDGQNIPVIESNQWTGGILLNKDGWTLDIEAYVKELVGITSLSNSFGELTNQPFSTGNSRIRGVDILLKKRWDKYSSWMSYTLSNALYEFPSIDEEPFPATHDQRHGFQWVHLYKTGPWEFTVGWQLRSGLPTTVPLGVEVFTNPLNGNMSPYFVYDKQNSLRLDSYHRLDVSALYHFGNKNGFNGFAGLSLLNIYDRQNILGKDFIFDEFDQQTTDYNVLEVNTAGLKFTPNIVVKVTW